MKMGTGTVDGVPNESVGGDAGSIDIGGRRECTAGSVAFEPIWLDDQGEAEDSPAVEGGVSCLVFRPKS